VSLWRAALFVLQKDLQIELRTGEVVVTTGLFATLVTLLGSLSFFIDDASARLVAPGVLWVTVAFSGVLAMSRTWARERDNDVFRGLLLSPAPRAAIYLGKLAATVALMLLVELVLTTLCGFLFTAGIATQAGRIALLLGLGTIGFAAAGCVFSAALLRSRSRDVLLSTLLYPIIVPIVIAGARGTSQLLDPVTPDLDGAFFWTQFLATLDAIFITVGLWAFEPVAAAGD